MHEPTTAGRARTVFRTHAFLYPFTYSSVFLGPLRFVVLFVCSSYSEEINLYHNCAFFETSGLSEKWEGCAHVIRITTPFATNLADGRPKSAPVAHWSRWFMCSLFVLSVLTSYLMYLVTFASLAVYVVSVISLWVFWCFAVDAATESCWRSLPFIL